MVHLQLCPPSFGFSDSGRPLLILLVSAAGSRLVAANRDGLGEDHGGMAYLYMQPDGQIGSRQGWMKRRFCDY